MRRFVLAAFALTLLAACQPATTELTEEQKAEIESAVRLVMDDMWAAARDWDLERLMGFWTQQDGFCLNQTTTSSCAERRASILEAIDSDQEVRLERQEMDGQDLRVMALTPTVALAAVTTEENRAYYTNGEVQRGRFANFFVLVLESGEWKLHSYQQASWPIEDDDGGEG